MTLRERLLLSAHLLVSIESERQRRNGPGLFRAVKQEIIWRELADLETECGRGSLKGLAVRGRGPVWPLDPPPTDQRTHHP